MLSGEEIIKVHEERTEKIKAWLRNKNVRQWKRSLSILYLTGKQMSTKAIAFNLRAKYHGIYRVLKKLEISSCIRSVKKKDKGKTELIWKITDHGRREVKPGQKNKIFPCFKR